MIKNVRVDTNIISQDTKTPNLLIKTTNGDISLFESDATEVKKLIESVWRGYFDGHRTPEVKLIDGSLFTLNVDHIIAIKYTE